MADFPAFPANDTGIDDFKTSIGFTPVTWPAGTTATLCKVPWDSEYRDVVRFATSAARDTYFNGLASTSIELEHLTYCKVSEPVKINIPYSKAYTYNYLVVENPAMSTANGFNPPVPNEITPPKLYYFISGVQMIAPNTTGLTLQLDVWMTYQIGVTLGRCFVERGHAALHAFTRSSGTIPVKAKRYLSAPEGLDCGASYIVASEERRQMGGTDPWRIVIVSAVKLDADYGTVNNPKLKSAGGMTVDGLVSGCYVYSFTTAGFLQLLEILSSYPWISNQILSVTAMPESAIESQGSVTVHGISAYIPQSQNKDNAVYANWTIANVDTFLKQNVSSAWSRHPKARTYPFTYIKMDNQQSQPITLMPEMLAQNTLEFVRMDSVVPPFQRICVFPRYYGSQNASSHTGISVYDLAGYQRTNITAPYGEKLDNALMWGDFPQFSITNDGYLQYMASNAHSLQFQRDNAGWGLDKSLANANTSYDNANRSLDAARENQRLAYNQQMQISRYNMGNLVSNQLGETWRNMDAGFRNAASGIVGTDIDRVISTTVNAANGSLANELGNQQFQNTARAQQGNLDANYKLQQWAARGDYQQSIAAINASVRDARMTSPTQSGTFGGGMFAVLASRGMPFWYIQAMTVTPGVQARIADYWDRFGYAIGEYMTVGTNFLLNKRFTYWKLQDVTLQLTNADEGVRQAIRGIFEKGVSVWSSASDITENPDTVFNDNGVMGPSTALY